MQKKSNGGKRKNFYRVSKHLTIFSFSFVILFFFISIVPGFIINDKNESVNSIIYSFSIIGRVAGAGGTISEQITKRSFQEDGKIILSSEDSSVNLIENCTDINSSGTYVLNNNISGYNTYCIYINSSNVILNGNGYSITGVHNTGIYSQNTKNLTIKNIQLKNYYDGISFVNVTNSTINNVNLSFNINSGLYISYYSRDNNVSDVNIISNNIGILFDGAMNNTFTNILIKGNTYGVLNQIISYNSNNFFNIILKSNMFGIYDFSQDKFTQIDADSNYKIITLGSIKNSSLRHTLSDNMIKNKLDSNLNRKIFDKDKSLSFNFSIFYYNGTIANNFNQNFDIYPYESFTTSKNSNNLTLNFIPSKEGIYNIRINVTLDDNNNVVRDYIIFIGNTSTQTARYYMHNEHPIHSQPSGGNDTGTLYTYPTTWQEETFCLEWVQYSMDSIRNLYYYIKDIKTGWYYKSPINSHVFVQKYVTYTSTGDIFKIIPPATTYKFNTANFSDINISYDYPWEFYLLALKLQGSNPSVISNLTKQSYADFTFLYSGPQIISFNGNPGSDISDVKLLSSTFDDNSKKNSTLQFEGKGSFIISLNLSQDNYTAEFDGLSCSNNPDCTINYNSGGLMNISININQGQVHTLRVYNIEEIYFLPEDVNEDGIIDFIDLVSVAQYVITDNCNLQNNWCNRRDVNHDTHADFIDLVGVAIKM